MATDQKHSVIINSYPREIERLAKSLPLGRHVEVRVDLTPEEYVPLRLGPSFNECLYTTGKSSEEFPTTITARDVVHRRNGMNVHTAVIKALLIEDGHAIVRPEDINELAASLDDLSFPALKFLLHLHEQWMDPVNDPDPAELAELATCNGLTLADFCSA